MIGNPVSLEDVVIEGGLFTVQLDFGADAFNGDPKTGQVLFIYSM